eukprot:scaffold124498_cov60-Phaeocystis_antarctica.AAC.2
MATTKAFRPTCATLSKWMCMPLWKIMSVTPTLPMNVQMFTIGLPPAPPLAPDGPPVQRSHAIWEQSSPPEPVDPADDPAVSSRRLTHVSQVPGGGGTEAHNALESACRRVRRAQEGAELRRGSQLAPATAP